MQTYRKWPYRAQRVWVSLDALQRFDSETALSPRRLPGSVPQRLWVCGHWDWAIDRLCPEVVWDHVSCCLSYHSRWCCNGSGNNSTTVTYKNAYLVIIYTYTKYYLHLIDRWIQGIKCEMKGSLKQHCILIYRIILYKCHEILLVFENDSKIKVFHINLMSNTYFKYLISPQQHQQIQ